MATKRAEQERLDREARARREEEDRIAREKREAEEKRVLEARAELEREQTIREKAAREIREASEATEKKLRDAAPAMLEALEECLAFVSNYVDVRDGSDGEQKPNAAMYLSEKIKSAIALAKTSA
jgi:hypothetical protein